MSQEILITLQTMLNSLNNPAYLIQNNEIILINESYKKITKNEKQFKKYAKEVKVISEDIQLIEIVPNDIKTLKDCTQAITKAMALL